jgi:hypothetical protein
VNLLPPGRSFELSRELLVGALDIHVHAGPHIFSSPRRVDPFEAAAEARAAGMRAIVYMDVFEMSNGTAWTVNRWLRSRAAAPAGAPPFTAYGGLILNTVYGGMNPRAVRTALAYGDGAKYVSFGAHSTYFQAAREGHVVDGRFVPLSELYPSFQTQELDRCIRIPLDAEPDRRLDAILSLIAEHPDVYLNTGHVSAEEAVRLVDLARRYGIERLLVASTVTKIASFDQLLRMSDQGSFIEYTLAAYTHTTPIPKTHYYVEREYMSIDEGMDEAPDGGVKKVAEQIDALGAERCIFGTDFGVYTLPSPVEGLRCFVACLLDLGIAPAAIRTMIDANPRKLLGLPSAADEAAALSAASGLGGPIPGQAP